MFLLQSVEPKILNGNSLSSATVRQHDNRFSGALQHGEWLDANTECHVLVVSSHY